MLPLWKHISQQIKIKLQHIIIQFELLDKS